MGEHHKNRRIVISPQRSLDAAVVIDRVNTVDGMLNRALGILDEQLTKLGLKSRSAMFDEKEARVLQGYVKSLVDLSKEEREREKSNKDAEGLKDMSDAELLELAQSKLSELKPK